MRVSSENNERIRIEFGTELTLRVNGPDISWLDHSFIIPALRILQIECITFLKNTFVYVMYRKRFRKDVWRVLCFKC
jgi:hypothetical protein